MTFDDLSRSQMTLDPKSSNRSANFFIVISVFVDASGKSAQICGRFKSSAQIGRQENGALFELWPLMTSSDLKRSVTPKANMNPTYLPLEVSKNI